MLKKGAGAAGKGIGNASWMWTNVEEIIEETQVGFLFATSLLHFFTQLEHMNHVKDI